MFLLCNVVFNIIYTDDPEHSCIEEEERRMEELFSTSFQEKEDEERIRAELDRQTSSTTTTTLDVLNNTKQDMTEGNTMEHL